MKTTSNETLNQKLANDLQPLLLSVKEKTSAAMMAGPFSDNIELTPAEATLVHRLLFERR